MDVDSKQQITNEEKSFSGKDDQKQQQSLRKKELKGSDSDVPVDAGSSLVGGTLHAVHTAVDRGIALLPASLASRAESLENSVIEQAANLQKQAQPLLDSYNKDGIVAAAKMAGGIGVGAAASLKDAALNKGAALKDGALATGVAVKDATLTKGAAIKDATLTKGAAIKDATLTKGAALKDGAVAKGAAIKDATLTTGAALKQKLPLIGGKPVEAGAAGEEGAAAAPKPKGRRRRGGRGHGNRKMKTRALAQKPDESIKETLGDKVSELKEVVVDAKAAATPSTGVIGNIRSTASGIINNATSTASGLVSGATSTASNLVSGATSTASGLVSGATSTASGLVSGATSTASGLLNSATSTASDLVSGATSTASGVLNSASSSASSLLVGAQDKLSTLTGNAKDLKADTLKGNHLEKKATSSADKPDFARQEALPVLGTPNTPADADVIQSSGKPLAVNASGNASASSGLIANAKFRGAQLVDAVKDRIDNLSMNADDTSNPDDKAGALERAKQQLTNMKASVEQAIAQKTGGAAAAGKDDASKDKSDKPIDKDDKSSKTKQ